MLNVPKWAIDFMKGKACPHCNEPMSESTIIQVGIKLKDNKPCLYYVSSCNSCENHAHTTIYTDNNFSPQQLAAEIYNSYDISKSKNNYFVGKNNKVSKSFESDCLMLKDFLKKCDDHNEFLRFIGLTDAEIEFYCNQSREIKNDDIS